MAPVEKLQYHLGCYGIYRHTCTNAKDRLICIIIAGAFIATLGSKLRHSYILHLYKYVGNPEHDMPRDVLMATRPEPTVPGPHVAHKHIVLQTDTDSMSSYSQQTRLMSYLMACSCWGA